MFTRESQALAARRIAEIKKQLAERNAPKPVQELVRDVPDTDDDAPF